MKRIQIVIVLLLILACCREETPVSHTAAPTGPQKAFERSAWSEEITSAQARQIREECPPAPGTACVTLKVTGLAYLVGTKNDKTRTLVVPKIAQHKTLLLTLRNRSGLSDKGFLHEDKPPQKMYGHPQYNKTYYYRHFPDAVAIDLKASGWDEPVMPVLDANETGDPAADCPRPAPDSPQDPPEILKESLHWLPHLATVAKHPSELKMTDLDEAYTKDNPDDQKVVTRLVFTHGRLEAEMSAGGIGKFQFWRTEQGQQDDHVQAIATYLRYRFPARLESVTVGNETEELFVLRGRRFQSNDSDVVIARFKPDDAGNIEIVLANTVNFFFLQPPQKIEHLKHTYDIFKKDAKVQATVPVRIAKCTSQPGESGVECGPLRVP